MSGQKTYYCSQNKQDKIRIAVDSDRTVWIGYENAHGYQGEVMLSQEDSQRLLKQLLDIENSEVI